MSAPTYVSYCESPLGDLTLQGDGNFLTGLFLPDHKGWQGPAANHQRADHLFTAVREQLAEYFAGARQQFEVPLKLAGTSFQLRVWQELAKVPFGTTITYAELAQRVGQSTASRAVGNANGRNPISIIVPCHRVIGASGKLTGYAGGVAKKKWLLDREAALTLQLV
jgi:methylated-DNA-[protein]-cysteine S-methyltransferase